MNYTSNDYDALFKLLICGNSDTGKTSLVNKFVNGKIPSDLQMTIGVDYITKLHLLNDKKLKLSIWDTTGQERFRSITSSYFKGCDGIILIYDISCKKSFNDLEYWMDIIKERTNKKYNIVIIGNKMDQERKISFDTASKYAEEHNIKYFETSIYDNVNEPFDELIKQIYKRLETDNDFRLNNKNRIILRQNSKKVCCYTN